MVEFTSKPESWLTPFGPLFLKNERRFAPPSLIIAYSGIKFFFTHTVPREWSTLDKLRVKRHKTLPDVLTTGGGKGDRSIYAALE